MEDDTLVLYRRSFGDEKGRYSVGTRKYGRTVVVPRHLYDRLRLVVRYQDADEEGKLTLRVLATGAYDEFIKYLKTLGGGSLPPVVNKESGPHLLRVTAEGRVSFVRGGEDVYFIGPTKVPKDLYDDFGVCEKYEAMRAAGIATDEAVVLGEECAATVARLQQYALSQDAKKRAQAKKPAAVVRKSTSGSKNTRTTRMTVKCGVYKKGANKGRAWYMVDGKFASCADYIAAGGKCKPAAKDCGKKKPAKKRVAKKKPAKK